MDINRRELFQLGFVGLAVREIKPPPNGLRFGRAIITRVQVPGPGRDVRVMTLPDGTIYRLGPYRPEERPDDD